jgi:hypothetical protein
VEAGVVVEEAAVVVVEAEEDGVEDAARADPML